MITFVPGFSHTFVVSHTHTHIQYTVRATSLRIRLVPPSGGLDFMGRLEVFHNNQWGTVCDDRFGFTEANVVCGMLNYTRSLCTVYNARFGQGTGMSL